jgi:hypothetical protein
VPKSGSHAVTRRNTQETSMATPQQDQISTLAYQLWEQEGRPEGRDREHWEQAQRMLDGDRTLDGDASPEDDEDAPGALVAGHPQPAKRAH